MTSEKQHIHGGNPEASFTRLDIPQHKVIDFSVNTSPLGPPRILFKNWNNLAGEVTCYPNMNGDGVADYYKARFNLDREYILPGNGSTECIYLVPRVLKLKRAAVIVPSFHDYERSCLLAGTEVVEVPLMAENGFRALSLSDLEKTMSGVDALMLGSPNNPTGTVYSSDLLLELADTFPDKWILVDEAFIQFLSDYEKRTLVNEEKIRKNLLVFHSLTKFYAIPGIRLGCVVGHPETVALLQKNKEPWTINGIAEKTASLLIDCLDYEDQLKRLIDRERRRFFTGLGPLKGLKLLGSSANFVLAQWTATADLDDLLRILLSNGLHVRDCRNFRLMEDNYFRFAIRKAADNEQLISHIARSIEQLSK